MKLLAIALLALMLSACGTLKTVQGAADGSEIRLGIQIQRGGPTPGDF